MVTVTQAPPPRLAEFWIPVFTRVQDIFAQPQQANAADVAAELTALIDSVSAQARHAGQAANAIEQTRFAVVAWADEIAMTREWPGTLAWRLSPLQKHYYATTRAGVEFFQRLEALNPQDHATREVYALALAAGFKGHFSARRAGELDEQRHKWLSQLQADAYSAPLAAGQPLFPASRPAKSTGGRHRYAQSRMATALMIIVPLLILAAAWLAMDALLAHKAASIMKAS